MIDRVYKFIQTVSNNELNGNISPQEFKLMVNNSVNELAEESLHEMKKEMGREQRYGKTFSIENITKKLREKIMHYYQDADVVISGGTYTLPEDLRYIDMVECDGIDAEPAFDRSRFKAIQKFIDTAPTGSDPLYLHTGGKLEVAPDSVIEVKVFYLRNPKQANWTYYVVKGVEIFNPDAADFQDIDIHPSEEYQLTIRLLQKLGINLKEEQLSQYGLSKEGNDFQKENAN